MNNKYLLFIKNDYDQFVHIQVKDASRAGDVSALIIFIHTMFLHLLRTALLCGIY